MVFGHVGGDMIKKNTANGSVAHRIWKHLWTLAAFKIKNWKRFKFQVIPSKCHFHWRKDEIMCFFHMMQLEEKVTVFERLGKVCKMAHFLPHFGQFAQICAIQSKWWFYRRKISCALIWCDNKKKVIKQFWRNWAKLV